jgi:glycosyltransferase involved in cell wall biosynthesis
VNILHIAAWWPNRVHPTHGNFVEKHVRLLAGEYDCTVVAVQEDTTLPAGKLDLNISERDGYRIVMAYYGAPTSTLRFFRLGTRARAYLTAVRAAKERIGIPDVLHGHILMDGGVIAAYLGRWWRRPVVISEHHHLYQHKRALPPLRAGLAKWACRTARFILPVTEQLGLAMRELNGLTGTYRPVSNVVDDTLFSPPAPAPAAPPPPLRILHVSNFVEPHKNVPGMLRVAKALERAHPGRFIWTVAGDGDHDWLRDQVSSVSLPPGVCTMSGPHTEKEIARLMQRHHVFVLFSRTENQPVVLLEALCSGLPGIATRVGGVADILADPARGTLVDSGDRAGLAEALLALLRDYGTYDRTAIARHAAARYGEAAVLQQLRAVYSECTQKT